MYEVNVMTTLQTHANNEFMHQAFKRYSMIENHANYDAVLMKSLVIKLIIMKMQVTM